MKRSNTQGGAKKKQKRGEFNAYASNRSSKPSYSSITMLHKSPKPRPDKGEEIKALVYSSTTTVPAGAALSCNSSGTILPLNLIQPGAGFYNRIGRRIYMKSLMLDINIEPLSVARNSVSDTCKIAIVYDAQTNGAIPTQGDIWLDYDQAGNQNANALSSVNLNNRDRFLVLRHWTLDLPAITNTATGVPTNTFPSEIQMVSAGGSSKYGGHIREYIKLKGLVTQYKADSNPCTIGDISTGALYLVVLATNVAGTEGYSIPEWNSRLRYYE